MCKYVTKNFRGGWKFSLDYEREIYENYSSVLAWQKYTHIQTHTETYINTHYFRIEPYLYINIFQYTWLKGNVFLFSFYSLSLSNPSVIFCISILEWIEQNKIVLAKNGGNDLKRKSFSKILYVWVYVWMCIFVDFVVILYYVVRWNKRV